MNMLPLNKRFVPYITYCTCDKTKTFLDCLEECIYSLKDLENYEIFIYLGKKVDRERQQMALGAAELDIDENSKWKLTTVLPGNKIPTAFMIHIKSEIKKYLLGEN